jgi:membrane-bound serine protease (ClpP class)
MWLLAWLSAVGGVVAAQDPAPSPGAVLVAEYDGVIHPIAAEFLDEFLARADASNARVAIFILRTPGGLLDSTRSMVSRLIASRTPVVVFVSPAGARAASAGFLITLAADVAAMAPGTHIGAAHPVDASGQGSTDEAMRDKAASDTAAYARTIAAARRRNVELAAEAVLQSRAFTEHEALAAEPPLIDLVATDLADLLTKLDGRRATRFDGREVTLSTSGASVEHVAMTRRQQLLSAIAHPQIAYLLLTLGMLGLVVELWNPGAILPGVVGGICLLLAFFAFQILPVDATGILLIVLGLVLLLLEIKVPSFGILGIGGIAALLVGSIMVTTEIPDIAVSYRLIVPTALAAGAIVLALGRLALKAQRAPATTGAEGMIGSHGEVITPTGPDAPGQIRVHGEIWRAISRTPIASGSRVRVSTLDGLTVVVEPAPTRQAEGDHT